jgi:hypothetical protein
VQLERTFQKARSNEHDRGCDFVKREADDLRSVHPDDDDRLVVRDFVAGLASVDRHAIKGRLCAEPGGERGFDFEIH